MRAAGRNADVFGRAWQLFARNLSIVVPGLVAGALTAVLEQLLTTWLWIDVTQIVAAILTISYTTGMADAAWRLGRARFSDGRRAFRRDGRHVLVAMLALMLLGAAAAVLAPYTFSFSIAAYVFFCIYTLAAAVVGERPGFLAVVESARIAFARPLPTLVMVAGVYLVVLGLGAVALSSASLPLLGPLVSDLVVQAVVGYVVLVVVGEYRLLRGLAGCGKTPGAVSDPPVPPKASSLFGHEATASLPHRSSFRRNIRTRSGHREFFRILLGVSL